MPPADPTATAGTGLGYHQLQRLRRHGVGWALLGVLALGVLVLLANVVVAVGAVLAAGGDATAVSTDPLTPIGLAVVNLGWAAAIPLVIGISALVHGLRPGLLASVAGRVRWRWLATCLGLALATLVVTLVVSAVLATAVPAAGAGASVTGSDADETLRTTVAFVLVVVLLTPLQAAGEEYAFRGYLTQALGGVVPSATVSRGLAVVVPAVLFALAHGAQDPPVFVDRLAFGLVAGLLVVSTGGLEAGIAMHVLNNFLAFGLALAVGGIEGSLTPSGGSWWSLPTTLTQSLVYLALVTLVARRTGLQTVRATPSPSVLEAPGRRV